MPEERAPWGAAGRGQLPKVSIMSTRKDGPVLSFQQKCQCFFSFSRHKGAEDSSDKTVFKLIAWEGMLG